MRGPVSIVVLSMLILSSMGIAALAEGKIREPIFGEETREEPEMVRPVENGNLLLYVRDITSRDLEDLKEAEGVSAEPGAPTETIDGHGTGLSPPTEEGWASAAYGMQKVNSISTALPMAINASKDLSTSIYFPPMGNQGSEGSCVSWSIGYYTKTFQEAKEHDWNLSLCTYGGTWPGAPAVSYQNRIMSPEFLYHQVNDGDRLGGSYYSDNIDVCKRTGICTWEKMPYKDNDATTWPSEAAWRQAPLYRTQDTTYYMWVTTNQTITSLKTWVDGDNLATISINAYEYSDLTAHSMGDLWTNATECGTNTNHANTIVGYDDNFGPYSEDGQTRYGAFKIANSWGTGWTGDSDSDGMYWISYKCMMEQVRVVFLMTDRIGYEPELLALFNISHSARDDCQITLGVGTPSSPTQTKRFDNYLQRSGSFPFPSNLMAMDITDFSASISDYYQKNYFVGVYDGSMAVYGSITHFSVEYYSNYSAGKKLLSATSTDPPVTTINYNTVYADVILQDVEIPIFGADRTPSSATTGDPLNFTVVVIDNREVYGAWIEYWVGSGSHTNASMSMNGTEWYLNISAPHTLEDVHYIFRANDTTGMWNQTTEKSLSMIDNDLPVIVPQDMPTEATTGDPLFLFVNVTDNIGVNNVTLQYNFGSGSPEMREMTNTDGDIWTYTILVPDLLTNVSLVFMANDTSDNWNMTTPTVLDILDNDLPVFVEDLTEGDATTGEPLQFRVNVTDNISVDTVWVEYWQVGDGHANVSMTDAGDGIWECNYSVAHNLTDVGYIFHANDTSDNWNSTLPIGVSVTDNDAPIFSDDLSDENATTGEEFTFRIQIYDNIAVDMFFMYLYREDDFENVSMAYGNKNNVTVTIVIPTNAVGLWEYYFLAYDTSRNFNYTSMFNRTIIDNDAPFVEEDLSDDNATTGNPYHFIIDAYDNWGVRNVTVEYWFGDGEHQNLTLIKDTDHLWKASVNVSRYSLESLHYIIWLNDTSGLMNRTTEKVMEVKDIFLPEVNLSMDIEPTTGDELNITVEVTDNIGVADVTLRYRISYKLDITNVEMHHLNNDTYYAVIEIPHVTEKLFISIMAVDINDIHFITLWKGFNITDNDAPIPASFEDVEMDDIDELVLNASGCTDNIGITNYTWTITGPVGRTLNGPFNVTWLPAGNYTVTLNITDGAGNYALISFNVTVSEHGDAIDPEKNRSIQVEVDVSRLVFEEGEQISLKLNVTNTGELTEDVYLRIYLDGVELTEYPIHRVIDPEEIWTFTADLLSYMATIPVGEHKVTFTVSSGDEELFETRDIFIEIVEEGALPDDDDIDDDTTPDDDTTDDDADDDDGSTGTDDDESNKLAGWLRDNYLLLIAALCAALIIALAIFLLTRKREPVPVAEEPTAPASEEKVEEAVEWEEE
ncbi:MAG: hypothetical protein ACMUIE_09590 [Thermoplasmatota archaeon]